MYRPKLYHDEGALSYFHRIAYYNGFKKISKFISYLKGRDSSSSSIRTIVTSSELLTEIENATNHKQRGTISLEFDGVRRLEDKEAGLKVCVHCFSEQSYLKKAWFSKNPVICYKHKVALEFVPNININLNVILNWPYIENYCQLKAQKPKMHVLWTILDQHIRRPNLYGIVNLYSFFSWRISLLGRYGMLAIEEINKLKRALLLEPLQQFETMFNILKTTGFGDKNRLFLLLYWAIVDPILELDGYFWKLNKSINDYICGLDFKRYATFYRLSFLLIYDVPDGFPLYCDFKKADRFKDLDFFDPGLLLLNQLEKCKLIYGANMRNVC